MGAFKHVKARTKTAKHVLVNYNGSLYMMATDDFRLHGPNPSATIVKRGALLPGSLTRPYDLRKYRQFETTDGQIANVFSDWSACWAR